MTMTRILLTLSAIGATATAQIVPAPQQFAIGGDGAVAGDLVRCEDPAFRPQVEALVLALKKLGVSGVSTTADPKARVTLLFRKDGTLPPEGYAITPGAAELTVEASSPTGAARAAASLVQTVTIKAGRASWPRMTVRDHPDHAYRSLLVDMGRNPHSPETLRQVVDMMWFYKANYLHLHLTDDQLISWPSKAFPKLYSERAGWTWENFVALEKYSQARGVTVIPELEVPGHSGILRGKYPEVFGKTPTSTTPSPPSRIPI